MKITKAKLREIVAEELKEHKRLNENPAAIVAAVVKYGPMIMQVVDFIKDNPDIIETLKSLTGKPGATGAAASIQAPKVGETGTSLQ